MLKGLTLTEFKEKFPGQYIWIGRSVKCIFGKWRDPDRKRMEWRKVYFGKWKKLPTGI